MARTSVVFLAVAGLVGLGAIAGKIALSSGSRLDPIAVSAPSKADGPVPVAVRKAEESAAQAVQEPGIFVGFSAWSEPRQYEAVLTIMGRIDLDMDVLAWCESSLRNRSLSPRIRNNLANVLLLQERPSPALAQDLLRMADDTTESIIWRDYAVQHAARAMAFSDNPEPILDRLVSMAASAEPTSLPGTALLQLRMLGENGSNPDLQGKIASGVAQILTHPSSSLESRLAAVAVIGECGLAEQAPLLRDLVKTGDNPSIRRVALASLGQIGTSADMPLVQKCLTDRHPLVVRAAEGALKRLQAKTAVN